METKWTLIERERGCFHVFIDQFNSALWASCSFPETASLSSSISMVSHIHVKNLNTLGIILLLFMLQMLTSQCFSFLTLYLLLWCICVVCVCVLGGHMSWGGGLGQLYGVGALLPPSLWLQELNSALQDCATGLSTHWTILRSHVFHFCVFTFLETQNIKMMLS